MTVWLEIARSLWPRDRVAAGYAIGLHYAQSGDLRILRAMLRAYG